MKIFYLILLFSNVSNDILRVNYHKERQLEMKYILADNIKDAAILGVILLLIIFKVYYINQYQMVDNFWKSQGISIVLFVLVVFYIVSNNLKEVMGAKSRKLTFFDNLHEEKMTQKLNNFKSNNQLAVEFAKEFNNP